jgi:formylglycine-generating enzyme required for sulfatase activity
VLETINLFLARTGWMFVLGASKQSLETALALKYGGAAARHFMEKIVQLSFDLPQVRCEEFGPLLGTANLLEKHQSLLIPAMNHNPRKLKRFINASNMLHGLLCSEEIEISLDNVLEWGILGCIYPDLAADIIDNPHNLFTLQKQIKRLEARWSDKSIALLTEEQLKEEKVPHKLRAHLLKPHVVDFLKAFDVTLEQYTGMLSLSRSVDVQGCTPTRDNASATLPLSQHAMASIAAGPLLFGADKATSMLDASFDIDIYLVTNGQFQIFMDAGGYANQTWWSQEGWVWRMDTGVRNPAHWDDSKWNRNDHPVVGLSWYEADAYARWVGMAMPTEQQWERAARGVDGWEYPWGNAFDQARCNAETAAITTPVYRYSNGVSPEGCYDMAGNVWEWTSSQVEEDQETYIIKGGSWSDDADAARCASRRSVRPDLRHSTVGFRCVRKTRQPH